jgi:hypothetical protein
VTDVCLLYYIFKVKKQKLFCKIKLYTCMYIYYADMNMMYVNWATITSKITTKTKYLILLLMTSRLYKNNMVQWIRCLHIMTSELNNKKKYLLSIFKIFAWKYFLWYLLDITEILLKVALNTITLTLTLGIFWLYFDHNAWFHEQYTVGRLTEASNRTFWNKSPLVAHFKANVFLLY